MRHYCAHDETLEHHSGALHSVSLFLCVAGCVLVCEKGRKGEAMAGSSMRAGKCMAALMRRGVVPSPLTTVLRTRSGAGLPVGSLPPPTAPLDENDELIWDDGNPFPEPCIDDVAPMVGKYEALAWTTGGLGFFALVGFAAAWWDKRRQCPWVPREVLLDEVQADAA